MVGCLRRNLYPFVRQFMKPYPLYLRKACWLHLYLPVALRFATFVVENKRQAGRYKLLRKTLLAVLHPQFFKLWSRQVPRPILYNARQLPLFVVFGNAEIWSCLKGRLPMLLKLLTSADTWSGSVKKQWMRTIL